MNPSGSGPWYVLSKKSRIIHALQNFPWLQVFSSFFPEKNFTTVQLFDGCCSNHQPQRLVVCFLVQLRVCSVQAPPWCAQHGQLAYVQKLVAFVVLGHGGAGSCTSWSTSGRWDSSLTLGCSSHSSYWDCSLALAVPLTSLPWNNVPPCKVHLSELLGFCPIRWGGNCSKKHCFSPFWGHSSPIVLQKNRIASTGAIDVEGEVMNNQKKKKRF